jgi:hypothetical protein
MQRLLPQVTVSRLTPSIAVQFTPLTGAFPKGDGLTHPPPVNVSESDNVTTKRRLTIHRIGCNINTLPRLTSAGTTPTHGEAIGTLGLIVTTGRRCLAKAGLEMTALAIALHEGVRTLTRGRILGRGG